MNFREQLEIENFLTIKNAVVDIRPFTILIGPEATGKSVIAKVLYFFRGLLSDGQFVNSITTQESLSTFEEHFLERFEKIFPRYTWENQKFSLTLRTDNWEFRLVRRERSGHNCDIELRCSDGVADLFRRAQDKWNLLSGSKELATSHLLDSQSVQAFSNALEEMKVEAKLTAAFNQSIFIPAGRSFFANLRRNIFSFLANDIPLDLFMKEFGSVYEKSRPFFGFYPRTQHYFSNEKIQEEVEKILSGKYLHADGQDWIISKRGKINLTEASSGQQEALPLLCILSAALHRFRSEETITFLIEEPEANLFPVSQRKLVNIFSMSQEMRHRFVLTTHSPYILTALNSLILASNISEREPDAKAAAKSIISPAEPVRFDDVSAYTINDGHLTSIMDNESRLIGNSIIDSVSDEFESVANNLLKLSLSRAS